MRVGLSAHHFAIKHFYKTIRHFPDNVFTIFCLPFVSTLSSLIDNLPVLLRVFIVLSVKRHYEMIGKTISHYRIIEKLGQGGMGVVYKAQDLKLDRPVALKFLPSHLTSSEEEKQRFIHEAKAASSLDHNNICNIFEIDKTDDGQFFIAMAYYEGETLDKWIEKKPLPIEEAIDIAIQIAQGLLKAHEKGIVHRDIKPANIMLTKEGTVKILDFGLAKLSTQTKLTKEGTTLGTISYMSPEQIRGDVVDTRSDIWSLGVIFYEMITGQLPFKGNYDQAVMYAITNENPEALSGLRSGVPLELERILNRMLSKERQDRYQHIDDLLSELYQIKKDSGAVYMKKASIKKYRKRIIIPIVIISIIILVITSYIFLLPDLSKNGREISSEWENSIAVLPFDNISNDPDQEYFCDGMTEQIITNLSKIKRLKVIARTSVMTYKNSDKQIQQIGKDLNVSYLLEGSIRKFGMQIRVTAQLVNTKDGSHIWADDFDTKLDNVFEVQDNISQLIVSNLLSVLSPYEKTVIKSKKPENTEAYDYFLRGSYLLTKYERLRQLSDLKMSEQYFKKAIEYDTNYANAYAFLSDVYGTFPFDSPEQNEKNLKLQEKYIQIAYHLDSLSSDILSRKSFFYSNKNKPENEFIYLKKSLVIDPNHYSSNLQMGIFLRNYGLPNHAIKYFNKAAELNPVDTWVYGARGWAYTNAGKFDKAEYDYQRALEISSNDYWSLILYINFLIMMNRFEEAKSLFSKFEIAYPNEVSVKYYEALLSAMQGDSLNAIKLLEQNRVRLWDRIILYCALDDRKEALSSLDETLQKQKSILVDPSSRFMELNHLPWFDNLRSDPRFQEILEKHKELYEENLRKYGNINI